MAWFVLVGGATSRSFASRMCLADGSSAYHLVVCSSPLHALCLPSRRNRRRIAGWRKPPVPIKCIRPGRGSGRTRPQPNCARILRRPSGTGRRPARPLSSCLSRPARSFRVVPGAPCPRFLPYISGWPLENNRFRSACLPTWAYLTSTDLGNRRDDVVSS